MKNKNKNHMPPRAIWEKFMGPIPKGFEIFFLDGNRKNAVVGNMGIRERPIRNVPIRIRNVKDDFSTRYMITFDEAWTVRTLELDRRVSLEKSEDEKEKFCEKMKEELFKILGKKRFKKISDQISQNQDILKMVIYL